MRLSGLGRWDIVVLAGVTSAFAIVYGVAWWTVLHCPRAIEYEGSMLWAANQLSVCQNIYDPARLTSAPWAVITYPPLFIAAASVLMKLFGTAFWCLRFVTIVGALISVVFLFRLLRLAGCAREVAAIAPAFFFGFSPTFLWANIGRPDILAVAFSLIGLERTYTALLRLQAGEKSTAPCVVAALMFALAIFTKQTSLTCALSAVLFLLWCKRPGAAIVIAAVGSAVALALCGITQLVTGGFVQNVSIFGHTPWDGDMLVRYMHFMNDPDATRVEILFGVLIYCFLIRKQETSVPERLPYLLTGLSLFQMIYIMGLPGSNGNHAILPLLALSWWLALKCSTLPKAAAKAVLLSSTIGLPVLYAYIPSLLSALPANDSALQTIDLKNRLVLSEDPYINILTGSQPVMIDCAVFTSVWKNQSDKLQPLEEAIVKKRFAAIVINSQDSDGKGLYFWPASVIEAVRSGYTQAGKLAGNGVGQTLWLPSERQAKTPSQ